MLREARQHSLNPNGGLDSGGHRPHRRAGRHFVQCDAPSGQIGGGTRADGGGDPQGGGFPGVEHAVPGCR